MSFYITSCEALWLLDKEMTSNPMGAGSPELDQNGKFADSEYNRIHFERTTRRRIQYEKNDAIPGYDHYDSWKASFDVINESSENPKWEKDLVIRLRKEAGLPIWPFMIR
jgi:hypothetical protein